MLQFFARHNLYTRNYPLSAQFVRAVCLWLKRISDRILAIKQYIKTQHFHLAIRVSLRHHKFGSSTHPNFLRDDERSLAAVRIGRSARMWAPAAPLSATTFNHLSTGLPSSPTPGRTVRSRQADNPSQCLSSNTQATVQSPQAFDILPDLALALSARLDNEILIFYKDSLLKFEICCGWVSEHTLFF